MQCQREKKRVNHLLRVLVAVSIRLQKKQFLKTVENKNNLCVKQGRLP